MNKKNNNQHVQRFSYAVIFATIAILATGSTSNMVMAQTDNGDGQQVPPPMVIPGLKALSGQTGCDNIVNWDALNTGTVSLLTHSGIPDVFMNCI